MSAPQFTPGPWKTGDCDGFIIWAPRFRSVDWIECEPGPEAVSIGDAACPGWALRPEIEAKLSFGDLMKREEWVDECQANARLMATSPDLYEALKALTTFAAATIKRLGLKDTNDIVGAANRALAKVEA